MPKFFFHTHDGRLIHDEQGLELPNARAAKRQGVRFLGEMLRDETAFWEEESLKVLVATESGKTLYVIEATGSPRQ